jgi:hypothetical protein
MGIQKQKQRLFSTVFAETGKGRPPLNDTDDRKEQETSGPDEQQVENSIMESITFQGIPYFMALWSERKTVSSLSIRFCEIDERL